MSTRLACVRMILVIGARQASGGATAWRISRSRRIQNLLPAARDLQQCMSPVVLEDLPVPRILRRLEQPITRAGEEGHVELRHALSPLSGLSATRGTTTRPRTAAAVIGARLAAA